MASKGIDKTIYFVRHGQVSHDVDENGVHREHDPLLNDEGRKQALQLQHDLDAEKLPIELILVSPMRRALETMKIGFQHYIEDKHIPVKVIPLLQDCGDWACNVGSYTKDLEKQFPGYDYTACHEDPVFPKKEKIYKADYETSIQRSRVLAEFFAKIPEKVFAVVTHGVDIRLFQKIQKPEDSLDAVPKEHSFSPCQHEEFRMHYEDDKNWNFEPVK